MKNLYKTLKDYIAKPLVGVALVATLNGCDGDSNQNQRASQLEQREQVQEPSQFTEKYLGTLSELGGTRYSSNIEMKLGDMDGDGDLDIVLVNRVGKIFLYENNLPQKK